MIIDAKRKDIKFYLDFLLVFVDGVYPTSGNRASSEWMDSAPKNGIIEFELIENLNTFLRTNNLNLLPDSQRPKILDLMFLIIC